MKKNVVVLFGSPHKNGCTSKMLNTFFKNFPNNINIKTFSAFDMNAKPCIDCGYCKMNNDCVTHDLDDFMKAFEECDIFIIASPVYTFSFPAPLKSILDRFQRYFNARFARNENPPIMKSKQSVLLMTCGSNVDDGFKISTHQLKRTFTVLNTKLVSSCLWSETDFNRDNVPSEELLKAFNKLDFS